MLAKIIICFWVLPTYPSTKPTFCKCFSKCWCWRKGGVGEHFARTYSDPKVFMVSAPWWIFVWYLLRNPTEAFCEWLKSPSNDFSTEVTLNSNILVTSWLAPFCSQWYAIPCSVLLACCRLREVSRRPQSCNLSFQWISLPISYV